ncbi:MAG TPA: serine hydrolase domain-containing protein [Pyrinomonadaceae bacterium]|jgi:CubicO group peptidase (beta-lactamase class C family)
MKRFSSALLMLSLLLASNLGALAQQQEVNFSELEKVVLEELKETRTPGAAIAIVSGNRIVFAKGFGVANVETNAPVTPDMLFRIASVTKMFTATALVHMAEQGKLKLNEPIGTYVKGLSPRLSELTTHQLLTHTSGIVNDARRGGRRGESALADAVRSWTDNAMFFEQPGKVYSYSNPGLTLAGFVLQEAGQKPYAEMMSTLLFKPLGMKLTTFRTTLAMTYPLSMGHDFGEDKRPVVVRPYPDDQEFLPAGGMISSVTDLARFAIAFMNDGRVDGQQVLSPSAISKLTTPYVDSHNAAGEWRQGYGMRMTSYRGVRVVEHLGGTNGFGSQLRMIPEHRFAVIILANSSLAQMKKTTEKAMELMLPLQPKPANMPEASLPLSAAEMSNFTGTYQNGPLRFQVFVKDNRLRLKVGEDEVALKKVGERLLSIDEREEDATAESALFKNMLMIPGTDGKTEYLYFTGRALKRVSAAK